MTKLQEKILDIMKAFDRVCRENGICYYMLGGTMLGAVRHKGFIPWDDDADFGLPREDYEKLLALPSEKIPEGFVLRHYAKEDGVPYAFARMEDISTTCIEARRSGSDYTGGVYIDLFPLDGDSNIVPLRMIKEGRVKWKKRLLYAHIAEPGSTKNPLKRLGMKWAVEHTNQETLVRELDELVSRYGETKRVFPQWGDARYSNYLGHWGRKESIPRRVFDGEIRHRGYAAFDLRRGEKIAAMPEGRTAEYEFEDAKFFGPVDSAGYLTALYGYNYMIPPEEELRQGHPAVVIDLERSYLEVENNNLNEE